MHMRLRELSPEWRAPPSQLSEFGAPVVPGAAFKLAIMDDDSGQTMECETVAPAARAAEPVDAWR